jgi:hypothetical protein
MVVLLINLFLHRFEIGFFDLKSMVWLQKKSKYVGVIGIFCKCHVVSRRSKEIAGMGAMTALWIGAVGWLNQIYALLFLDLVRGRRVQLFSIHGMPWLLYWVVGHCGDSCAMNEWTGKQAARQGWRKVGA